MPSFSEVDKKKIETFISIQTRHEEGLSNSQKKEILKKRNGKLTFMIFINLGALFFFLYSFYFGISSLSSWVIWVLFGIFGLNIGMIVYQKQTLGAALHYLDSE